MILENFKTDAISKELFNEGEFDFIVTRQVLEHIRDLHDFLQGIDYILNESGVLIIEVPDHTMNYELFDYSFWEEHINYFTLNTLKELLKSEGFYIFHHENILFSGKAMILYCKKIGKHELKDKKEFFDRDNYLRSAYISKFEEFKSSFHYYLDTQTKGKNIVIYGAGCRSLCLSSFLELNKFIDYFVDDSPQKAGKYVPGSNKKILSSEYLTGNEIILLATNSEIESTIIKKHDKSITQFCSILPPSGRLPDFWLKYITH